MAIEFSCPHCQHPYRLKDELAGKRATCKNPACRKVFVIPAPVALRAEEIESVAVSVLTDEPGAAVIQTEAAITMHCDYCGHEWQEPRSKAGKNVLCPECRQRLRVPEPKGKEASDWRNAHTRLPSLARQNQEKLDGVIDASEVQLVSGQALAQAGVTEVELEPRPLREKLLIAGLVVGVVALIAGSTYYLLHRRQVQKGEELLVQAQTYWQEGADDLSSVEATLGKALLYLILAEEAFHWENPDKFKQAYALLQKSRQELRNAPASPLRHALALEGSFLTLRFGGDASQVAAQTRLPWLPDSGGRAALLRTERIRTVHEELRLWLSLLQGADYDLRLAGARRLGRYLLDHDQWELALDGLPLMLFQDNERHDIRAQLALEAHLLGKGNERLSRLARELLPEFSSGGKEGAPAPSPAVLVLWQVTAVEKAPPLPPLPPQGTLPEALRYGHVLHLNLQGDTTSALNVAQRGGPVESQLKALLLGTECCCLRQQGQVADWLTAAATLVSSSKGKPNVRFADGQLFRFGQLAAAHNRPEAAQTFAEAIRDDGLRSWAVADTLRERSPVCNERYNDELIPIPADSRKIGVGHLWGRFWIARHNARLSGDRAQEQRALLGWSPRSVYAFGLAGLALGLQDR